jgi:hypothetical protein
MEKKITLLIIILLLVPIVAIAAHYTVNRDGTVTDNVTGLMWQQEVDYIAPQHTPTGGCRIVKNSVQ